MRIDLKLSFFIIWSKGFDDWVTQKVQGIYRTERNCSDSDSASLLPKEKGSYSIQWKLKLLMINMSMLLDHFFLYWVLGLKCYRNFCCRQIRLMAIVFLAFQTQTEQSSLVHLILSSSNLSLRQGSAYLCSLAIQFYTQAD